MENSNHELRRTVTDGDIYSAIFTRASTRKFDPSPVPAQTLQQIEDFISTVTPLLPGVDITHRILDATQVKGLALPKAPHFLLISGKPHTLRNICAGFVYQQAVLFMHSVGLAGRWLSSVKAKETDPDHIIGIAFGRPLKPVVRKPEEFDRKPLGEIARGCDPRLEAVRLAPSGMNGQPWYFVVDNGAVYVYFKERLGGLMGKLYNQTDVDCGIGLCHLAVAGRHEGKPFVFIPGADGAPVPRKGYVYAGAVK